MQAPLSVGSLLSAAIADDGGGSHGRPYLDKLPTSLVLI